MNQDLFRVTRTIRGTRSGVTNALRNAEQDGRLVAFWGVRFIGDGQVEVKATLLEPAKRSDMVANYRPTRRTMVPWYRSRPRLAATLVALVVGVVGFLAYLVYELVVIIAAHLAEVLFTVAIGGLVLIWIGHKITRAAGCCPCHRR